MPKIYSVTFVGQPHGSRRYYIQALRDNGIDVQTWGLGWENGRISQQGMIKIFNQSKINLNLSNASTGKNDIPLRAVRKIAKNINILQPVANWIEKFLYSLPLDRNSSQIKGRNFEIPGCGGFLLTDYADDLEQYYNPQKEIVCFKNQNDFIEKVKYYSIQTLTFTSYSLLIMTPQVPLSIPMLNFSLSFTVKGPKTTDPKFFTTHTVAKTGCKL